MDGTASCGWKGRSQAEGRPTQRWSSGIHSLTVIARQISAQNTGYSKPPLFHSHLKPPTWNSAKTATASAPEMRLNRPGLQLNRKKSVRPDRLR